VGLRLKKIATTIKQLSEVANNVAVGMRQQDAVTQEIARNAGAAAKGTRDVSEHITEVSNSTTKTGQMASKALTAAAELADQSHLLRHEVERHLAQPRLVCQLSPPLQKFSSDRGDSPPLRAHPYSSHR